MSKRTSLETHLGIEELEIVDSRAGNSTEDQVSDVGDSVKDVLQLSFDLQHERVIREHAVRSMSRDEFFVYNAGGS